MRARGFCIALHLNKIVEYLFEILQNRILRSELIRCCPIPFKSGSTSLARLQTSFENSFTVTFATFWH